LLFQNKLSAGSRAADARGPREHHDDAALHERTCALARRINASGACATHRACGHRRRKEHSGGL